MDCELSSEMGTHPTQSQSRGIGKAKMRCSTEGQRRGEGVSPTRTVKQKVKQGLWSPEEDKKLTNYIMRNGLMGCWSYIAQQAGLQRCSKSCRLRWINYLRPGLKRGAFSLEEERQIIHLQSILGNRWSQIAAHLQGRTDNQIKNYWNCWIKKKIKSKHHTHSTANGVTDTKSNIPSQPHRICNSNSVFAHGLQLFTPSDTVQPYLDVILEGQQPRNNTSNVVTTGENEFSVPGVLESIHEEGHDQNLKLSIETNCTSNHLFCRSQVGIYSTSTRTHDCLPAHDFICPSLHTQGHNNYETAKQTDWWTAGTLPLSLEAEAAYTITVPNLSESQLLEEELKNHIDGTIFNENEIMIDYSLFTTSSGISGWSASNSYSNIAGNCPHLPDPVASPFVDPTAGQFNDFLFVDDYKDGLNLGYDVDLEVSSYSYLWAQNKEGWRVGD